MWSARFRLTLPNSANCGSSTCMAITLAERFPRCVSCALICFTGGFVFIPSTMCQDFIFFSSDLIPSSTFSFPRGVVSPQSIGLLPNLSALLLGGRIPDPTALGGSLPRSLATLPRLSRVIIAWYAYMRSLNVSYSCEVFPRSFSLFFSSTARHRV